ncbi:hypothetical protein GF420_05225 [candidate division GN15 bacterium]|nr:hypothetical protein [candidate division GN15 bacterium]
MTRRTESFGNSRTRRRKAQLKTILLKRDLAAVQNYATDEKAAFRTLQSLLWDSDLLVVWRSIEAIGLASKVRYAKNPEDVRELIRKLLWCMNDESGNLCWFAAEAIAEILTQLPQLRKEFLSIWLGFLDEEPFEAGVRWGMARLLRSGRVSDDHARAMRGKIEQVRAGLDHPQAAVRGMTLLALEAIEAELSPERRERLSGDADRLNVYNFDSGQLDLVEVRSLLPAQLA